MMMMISILVEATTTIVRRDMRKIIGIGISKTMHIDVETISINSNIFKISNVRN